MKLYIILFVTVFILLETPVVEEVRDKFPYIENEEETDSFIDKLEEEKGILAEGYLAAMYFFKSRFVGFPTTKYKYFKKGKSMLDAAISMEPNNVELRYIRFIFQHQIPSFLGYDTNKQEDFEVIINSEIIDEVFLLNLLELNDLSLNNKQQLEIKTKID